MIIWNALTSSLSYIFSIAFSYVTLNMAVIKGGILILCWRKDILSQSNNSCKYASQSEDKLEGDFRNWCPQDQLKISDSLKTIVDDSDWVTAPSNQHQVRTHQHTIFRIWIQKKIARGLLKIDSSPSQVKISNSQYIECLKMNNFGPICLARNSKKNDVIFSIFLFVTFRNVTLLPFFEQIPRLPCQWII